VRLRISESMTRPPRLRRMIPQAGISSNPYAAAKPEPQPGARNRAGRTAAQSTLSSNSTAPQRPHPKVGALGKTAQEEQTPLYGAINSVT
jgi:hypothetical protein